MVVRYYAVVSVECESGGGGQGWNWNPSKILKHAIRLQENAILLYQNNPILCMASYSSKGVREAAAPGSSMSCFTPLDF